MRRFPDPTFKSLLAGLGLLTAPTALRAQVPAGTMPPSPAAIARSLPAATPCAAGAKKSAPDSTGGQNSPPVNAPGRDLADPPDCRETLDRLKADFAREPGRLLLAVEDALTTQEACACLVVKTAVDFAATDRTLTGQIVVIAIRTAPAAAARIADCALAQSPGAASAIRAALSQELGENAPDFLESGAPPTPAHGKAPGPVKASQDGAPVEMTEITEKSWPAVGVSGIYAVFTPPNRVRRAPDLRNLDPEQVLSGKKMPVQRPIFPVTRHIPE